MASDEPEYVPSAVAEQQSLLPPEQPPPPMASDATKPVEGRQGDGAANVIIWISYIVFLVSTWFIILSNNPASLGWFKFHPLLQTLSIGCFTYGVLTLQPTAHPQTKAAGLQRHQIATLLVGLPLILLGALAVFANKNSHHAPHFTTWHSTFGLITVVWLLVQALVGGSTVWFGGAVWGGGMRAKALWKYHRLSGYILLPVLLFTAHLGGGWSDWVVAHSDRFVQLLAYTVAPLLILAGVYTRVRSSKMKIF